VAWLIAAIVAGILVLIVIVVQAGMIRTAWRMVEYTPPLNASDAGADPRAESVSFQTSDGLRLNGAIFLPEDREPRGMIVFCHEFGGSRWSALSYTEALIDAGFAVFSFDFRGHGDSDLLPGYEPFHWITDYEVDDLRSALSYVSSHAELSHLPVGMFGISRGGGTALAVAGEDDQVKAIVCESAYSCRKMMYVFSERWHSLFGPDWLMTNLPHIHATFTLAAARWLASLRRGCRFVHIERVLARLRDRPVLLISGKRDNYVRPEIAENIVDGIASELTTLWLVPKSRHNQAREIARQEYDERLVALFDQLDGQKTAEAAENVDVSELRRDEQDDPQPQFEDESLASR
jgi:pimeloyl-ACP methyl ester carboxylesterase